MARAVPETSSGRYRRIRHVVFTHPTTNDSGQTRAAGAYGADRARHDDIARYGPGDHADPAGRLDYPASRPPGAVECLAAAAQFDADRQSRSGRSPTTVGQ